MKNIFILLIGVAIGLAIWGAKELITNDNPELEDRIEVLEESLAIEKSYVHDSLVPAHITLYRGVDSYVKGQIQWNKRINEELTDEIFPPTKE